jgi:hypothetical protein
VTAPTLLIVGGNDPEVLDVNRQAQGRLRAESRLEIVPSAGHLFAEAGALERGATLAAGWVGVGEQPEAREGGAAWVRGVPACTGDRRR